MQLPITFDSDGVSNFKCAICGKPIKIGAVGMEMLCGHVPVVKTFADGRKVAEWETK